ncbi:MAG: preprotein translocase subunit SecG [Syntrophaceae bacterium CG2_30_49_12]|nr:MAG: preprotein translocase subunit SecG [Syntrophaceae bacterium CG2_30_49_12]PIP06817.1 MAG: preprotein translocase subunit SecG [Syntrophobacterales bacterium CG23_combo_of_CG06-09_8_20_14_all_48_27]PJC74390.1 MAG: preprotein translocase subunit SecG [Syntrophobacterales bacterium CG_4_8_14_3_um_filter_49_14]
MHTLVTILHIFACIVLICVVLLQAGKGADMGAAFGGSSQTIFGSGGPGTFLGKMTTVVAAVFMLTSLALSYAVYKGTSLMDSHTPRPAVERTVPTQTEKRAVPLGSEKATGATEQKTKTGTPSSK